MTVFRKLRLNAVFLGISALLMGSGAAAFAPSPLLISKVLLPAARLKRLPAHSKLIGRRRPGSPFTAITPIFSARNQRMQSRSP